MTAPGSMTLAELQKLIAESKGEWEHIEFKKTTGELHGGMETLCGFLNGSGGKVLFGVTNAGRIQGQDVTDATFQEVANAIRKLEPPAWIEQTRVPVGGHQGSPDPGDDPADGRPLHLRRPTLPADRQHDIPDAAGGVPAAAAGPARAPGTGGRTRSPKGTPRVIWTSRRSIGPCGPRVHCGRLESQSSDPLDALDRLQLRVDGQLLNAAVVLFGRKFMPDYPQCTVRLARFKGTDKSEFLDQRQLHGHAFQILDESMHFILRNIPIAGQLRAGQAGTARCAALPAAGPAGSPGQCDLPPRLHDRRRSDLRRHLRRPAGSHQPGTLATGHHGGRPQAGPRLPPPQPADRRGLLSSRADRAVGAGHAEDRGLVRGRRPAGARVRGASRCRRGPVPAQRLPPAAASESRSDRPAAADSADPERRGQGHSASFEDDSASERSRPTYDSCAID